MLAEKLLDYFAERNALDTASVPNLHIGNGSALGHYRGMHLSSVFQPLLDARSLQARAHEALLRVHDDFGRALSPAEAFAIPATADDIVYFDRLCRIVHALNFVGQAPAGAELFLNVSGRHLLGVSNGGHGEIFERLLDMCGLKPEQVILEVLEAKVDDISRLNDAVGAYRERGYRVAIDDFGCENSNFDRLWRLTPDIVKLDRSLILQGTSNERARRILPRLVDIIHELGAQVVCEGIETPEQHQLAVDAGADLLQGYYYAIPSATLAGRIAAPPPQTEEKAWISASPRKSRITSIASA